MRVPQGIGHDPIWIVDETIVNIEDLMRCGIRGIVRVIGNPRDAVLIQADPDVSFDYIAGFISEDA